MLYANAADAQKVENKIIEILESLTQLNHTQALVHGRDFYRACQLEKLPGSRFVDEVSDTLTLTDICKKYGVWLYAEYGDGMYAFVKSQEPAYEYSFRNAAPGAITQMKMKERAIDPDVATARGKRK